MLARLRRRFIIITMSLIGLVLLIVLALSLISGYQTSLDRIDGALLNSLNRGTGDNQLPWIGGGGGGAGPWNNDSGLGGTPGETAAANPAMTPPTGSPLNQNTPMNETSPNGELFVPVYVASIDVSNHEIISDNSDFVNIDGSLLSRALDVVADKLTASNTGAGTVIGGHMLDLKLMYRAEVGTDGSVRMALADTSSVITDSLQRLAVSALIWLGAMLVFFFISLLLSKIALRPVAEAWEKQRQFVADASHELKTPLTVILANNSLLKAHPDKTIREQMHWLENTELEAQRMDDLVRNLLLLAQTDEEERSVWDGNTETVDLSALVQQNLLQFETVLFERGIELSSDIADGVEVTGRDDQLSRLVYILLDNASKYASTTPANANTSVRGMQSDDSRPASVKAAPATVHVALQPVAGVSGGGKSGKHSAILTVTNSGEPIDHAALPHLFDRFYRGDQAHSDAEGSGLGLSLAKSIVSSHKGEITAQSDAEHGTTFTVFLP